MKTNDQQNGVNHPFFLIPQTNTIQIDKNNEGTK